MDAQTIRELRDNNLNSQYDIIISMIRETALTRNIKRHDIWYSGTLEKETEDKLKEKGYSISVMEFYDCITTVIKW